MVRDVELVLGEERHQYDDFVAGIENRLQNHVACARGADSHEDVFRGKILARLSLKFLCDGLADLHVARIWHVAMRARTIAGGNAPQRIDDRRRRLDIRVAKRKIEDGIGSAFTFEPNAFLEHAPNPGGVFELAGDGF